MKLFHYTSDDNFSLNEDNFRYLCGLRDTFKPNGLWVTPEETNRDITWPDFCRNSGSDFIERLRRRYIVDIDTTNILHLKSISEMENFQKEYSVKGVFNNDSIKWSRVEKDYNGILIIPWQYKMKYQPWYSSWDCSSGCIWTLKNIVSIIKDNNYDDASIRNWYNKRFNPQASDKEPTEEDVIDFARESGIS